MVPVTHQAASSANALRLLLLACLVNAAMGILYVWSLFLLPMETFLDVSRSTLSLVPAFSLVFFTLGMVVHARLLRRLTFRPFALLSFFLAGGGYLLFAWGTSYATLLLGYGVLFGFGSGLGYGLALALVTQMPAEIRSTALGIVMAAFAISGVALSSFLAGTIREADPSRSFLAIGVVLILVGLTVALLLPALSVSPGASAASGRSFRDDIRDPKFLKLGLVFFTICYVGLMVVAHATGILAAQGLSPTLVGLAPGTFTFGYIVGSFAGGKLVDVLSGPRMLVASNVLAALGLLILTLPASPLLLAGTFAIGIVFGGSASLMPALIGEQYGVERIGDVYGKLMVAYGAAGLVAPWLSGRFYSATGSYAVSLVVAIVLCVAGILLARSTGASRNR